MIKIMHVYSVRIDFKGLLQLCPSRVLQTVLYRQSLKTVLRQSGFGQAVRSCVAVFKAEGLKTAKGIQRRFKTGTGASGSRLTGKRPVGRGTVGWRNRTGALYAIAEALNMRMRTSLQKRHKGKRPQTFSLRFRIVEQVMESAACAGRGRGVSMRVRNMLPCLLRIKCCL